MPVVQIGVLGATGPAGRGLSARLAANGHAVVLGSREQERAAEAVAGLHDRWPDHALDLTAATNEGAADAEVVVVATPWIAASSTAEAVADRLAGKVVISMANALAKVGHEFQPLVPPRGSVAASVQAAAPAALVAAAFHHVPAKELGDLTAPVESDVLVCSDHAEATAITLDLVNGLPDLRALDSGELSNAAPIEAFAAVLLQVNVRYRTRLALKFTGLDEGRVGAPRSADAVKAAAARQGVAGDHGQERP